jgi:predicted GNAT family N-acyltransferase
MKNAQLPAPMMRSENAGITDGRYVIKVAESKAGLDEIYHLRYKVYVDEMHSEPEHAEHLSRRIIEPLDKGAINIGAWIDGRVIGCIRLNLGDRSDFAEFKELLGVSDIPNANLRRSIVCGKLIVDSTFRNSRINVLLQQFCYRIAIAHDMQYCFIACKERLAPYYIKFGFRTYKECVYLPEYGELTPLLLHVQDIDYLASIRSPFLPIYDEMMASRAVSSNAA